jgi:hypothetical protein
MVDVMKDIQEDISWCTLFADDVELIGSNPKDFDLVGANQVYEM